MRSSMKHAILSGFFPTHADFFNGNAFIIMKLSKLPSFIAIRALTASQSTFEMLISTVYFLSFLFIYFCIAFYGISHEFCSVLRCNILGIGLF